MLILDLWGIRFHAVTVFGLGKNLLFKPDLGHCVLSTPEIPLTHTICKNSIPGEMGMNIDKDHVRRRIRQTLKDKEIDRPGNLTRDTCQI